MFTLGIMYEQGLGVEADAEEAFNAYKNPLRQGMWKHNIDLAEFI